MNFKDGDNMGLKSCNIKSNIPKIYETVCDRISLADFSVIAAEAMMAVASPTFNKDAPFGEGSVEENFMKGFFFGRQTAEKCDETHLMPNPENGCNDLQKIFNKHLFWRK